MLLPPTSSRPRGLVAFASIRHPSLHATPSPPSPGACLLHPLSNRSVEATIPDHLPNAQEARETAASDDKYQVGISRFQFTTLRLAYPYVAVLVYRASLSPTPRTPVVVSWIRTRGTNHIISRSSRASHTLYFLSRHILSFTGWRPHVGPRHDIAHPHRRPAGAAASARAE